MAFTEADLQNIKNAELELAMGRRVVRVTIGGKSTEYGQADLAQLRMLRGEAQADVNAAAGQANYFLTSTSKGL